MSKTETLVLAISISEKAAREIAFCKGQIAACHRTNVGNLVPKFDTDEELAAWHKGWTSAKSQLAG